MLHIMQTHWEPMWTIWVIAFPGAYSFESAKSNTGTFHHCKYNLWILQLISILVEKFTSMTTLLKKKNTFEHFSFRDHTTQRAWSLFPAFWSASPLQWWPRDNFAAMTKRLNWRQSRLKCLWKNPAISYFNGLGFTRIFLFKLRFVME